MPILLFGRKKEGYLEEAQAESELSQFVASEDLTRIYELITQNDNGFDARTFAVALMGLILEKHGI